METLVYPGGRLQKDTKWGCPFCFSYVLLFIQVILSTCQWCNPIFTRSAGESANKRAKDGWMKVTVQAHKTVLSCTVTTASFPASCCGMLKVSSFSPTGSWQSDCNRLVGVTHCVISEPFPMLKVMLTLTWGLVVVGLRTWGLVAWEGGCTGTLVWGGALSAWEHKVMGSDSAAECGPWRAAVDCEGPMDSKLLQSSLLVKRSVELLLWLWLLQASASFSRGSPSWVYVLSWVSSSLICKRMTSKLILEIHLEGGITSKIFMRTLTLSPASQFPLASIFFGVLSTPRRKEQRRIH